MEINYCKKCKRQFVEPKIITTTYESYYGVSSVFQNSNKLTLEVCPFCESEDFKVVEIKNEEEEKNMKNKLLELGFKALTGVYYLAEAVEYKIKFPLATVSEIYDVISIKYKVSFHCVERCIRHVIQTSKTNYKEMTNKQTITSLAIRLGDFK